MYRSGSTLFHPAAADTIFWCWKEITGIRGCEHFTGPTALTDMVSYFIGCCQGCEDALGGRIYYKVSDMPDSPTSRVVT
jgi:hypothetical protein